MVANPDCRISDLEILTPEESARIVGEWNYTTAPFPEAQCVHQLIEEQAARTPDAEAVRSGDVSLTYGELMRRSNRLANRLRAMGVGPESLVGVCMDRTHEMVVALLGVWKAGGAYVPLDPSYPNERIAFMMEDAGLTALVTEESLLSEIPAANCPIVCVDRDADAIARESDIAPNQTSGPRNLAYIIYTSGSTGKPKGVLVEHRSVANFLSSMRKEPGLTRADSVLSVTTLSFDIAGLEMYLPLVVGARVILLSRMVASDGLLLARTISESGATVMQATPATWRLLLDAGWQDARGLKILSGGEALPRRLADGLLATGAELWNMYGPTETTIWSTIHRVGHESGEGDPTPIGRPIANTKLYVLDENRHPVPVNVPGELYIGGAGLARGYHNRPELTAERFVENPFVSEPGARMYRTGDQVRYRVDGTVEYLGRLDNQVKVRGFRIELGEIESVLATHERVQNAVVLANEYTPGDQRLVAYLVGTDGDAVNSLELRHWLSLILPQYMIPSAFVFVDAFPLTPNGKIDRRALLTAGSGSQHASQSSIPPQPGLESVVAQVWRETLGVTQVWADDNFFDLGGNSLLGIRLLANLEKVVGQRLPVSVLFEGQTVRNMTAALGQNSSDDPLSLAVRIKSGSEDRPPLFIIPGVNGNVIGYETLAQLLPSEQPVYGLRSVGLNGNVAPLDQMDVIAKHFIDDVRKIQPNGPYHFAGFCIGGSVAYEMAQQLATQSEQVALLAMIGTWPPSSVEDMVSTSPSAQKLAFLGEGIVRHLRAMLAQPRGQRLAYLIKKARIILEMIAHRDVYRGDTEALHRDWVSGTNRRAAARYNPTPYAGDVLFVIPDSLSPAPDLDPRLTWRDLVRGESTIIRLPGDDSGTLLRPPYMAGLAEVLSERVGDPTISIASL
jgi:amino acid adenylation domain-containing protein